MAEDAKHEQQHQPPAQPSVRNITVFIALLPKACSSTWIPFCYGSREVHAKIVCSKKDMLGMWGLRSALPACIRKLAFAYHSISTKGLKKSIMQGLQEWSEPVGQGPHLAQGGSNS